MHHKLKKALKRHSPPRYKSPWVDVSGPRHPALALDPREQEQLLGLPRRLVPPLTDKVPVFLTLLDLLYAASYDERVNLGERGPETGWCVAKLSASLAACTKHGSMKAALVTCVRRLAF